MAYCEPSDLILGDIVLPTWLVPADWVNLAADEIDSKLGFIYKVPLEAVTPPGGGFAGLAVHEQKLVKGINYKLASGRIILALDSGGEDTTLHAYGLSLVREATNELMQLANGNVQFPDAALNANTAPNGPSVTPGVANGDEMSLVDAWSNTVLRGEPQSVYPGQGKPVPPLVIYPNPPWYPRA